MTRRQLSPDTVEQIRQAKRDGMPLLAISKKFGCAKSTASLYCRDLFDHPNQMYKTERTARQAKRETARTKKQVEPTGSPWKCKPTFTITVDECPSPESPNARHHYKIDSRNFGVCKYCGKEQQFVPTTIYNIYRKLHRKPIP